MGFEARDMVGKPEVILAPQPGDLKDEITEKDQTLNLVLRGEIEQMMRRAEELRLAGDLLAALEVLEAAATRLAAPPRDRRAAARVDLRLAEVLFEDGRVDLGIERLEKAYKLDPDLSEAVETGRRVYRMLGDFRLVARLYEVELESSLAGPERRRQLWAELGRVRQERLADRVGAIQALEEAVRLGAHDAPTLELLATLHLAEDPVPAATLFYQLGAQAEGPERVRYLRRALGADASHAAAAAALEESYRSTGAVDELLQLYRMPGAPTEQAGWATRRARAFAERGLLDEAEEAARVALAEGAGPGWVEELSQAAVSKRPLDVARMHLRLTEEALAWASSAATDESDDAKQAATWLRKAAARAQAASAFAEEEIARRRAHELVPNDEAVFGELAELLARRKDAVGLRELTESTRQPARLEILADLLDKRLGDARGAAAAWRRAEAAAPSPRGPIELRRLQQKEERWTSAEATLLRELEKAAPGAARADVLRRLGQLDRDRHQLDDAAARIEAALGERSDDPQLLRTQADLFEARGRFAEAQASLAVLAALPSLERAERLNVLRRLLQISHERLEDPAAIGDAARQILALLPSDRDALGHLESVARRLKDDAALLEAVDRHATAAALPAERVPLLIEAAALAERLDDLAGAKERLERAARLGAPTALAALGRVQAALGMRAEALLTWDRIRKAAPDSPEAATLRRPRARVLDALGETARAVAAWREVLDHAPGDREALAMLSQHGGDIMTRAELLAWRAERADADEARQIFLERARLLASEPRNAVQTELAIVAYRQLLAGLAPGHGEVLTELRALLVDAGKPLEAARAGELAYALATEPAERLGLALEIAMLHEAGGDRARAERAYRRVLVLDANQDAALEALSGLLAARGAWTEVMAVDERRLELTRTVEERVTLSFALALTAEERLANPERAFALLHGAHRLQPDDGTLAELRRLAERHGLWEQMLAVYAESSLADARRRQAELVEERLGDPGRAFVILSAAPAEDTLAEMERLAARANTDEIWDELLHVYDVLLEKRTAPLARGELYHQRSLVKEQRLGDLDGAFDEALQRLAVASGAQIAVETAQAAVTEVRRLGELTGRWEDVVAAQAFRFERATGAARLEIALEAARLVEERLGDRRRAFRAYLRALTLAPTSVTVRDELWRLGRSLATEPTTAPKPKPPIPTIAKRPTKSTKPTKPPSIFGTGLAIGSTPVALPGFDSTQQIRLEDLIVDDSGPIPVTRAPRPDATVELSIEDLIAGIAQKPAASTESTVELSISDLVKDRPAPPPLPSARPPVPTGALSAWQELALVLSQSGVGGDQAAFVRAQAAVAEMWECGAGQPRQAFEALLEAFRADPDDADLIEELDRLAVLADGFGALRDAVATAIDASESPERAVRLLLRLASLTERRHLDEEAETHYLRALGIRPDEQAALIRLEDLYRRTGRDRELANLLERRLNGLIERMPPGTERRARAVELAEIYERLGQTYEAIGAWRRVADESPDDEPAEEALARLYERSAQWSKVVEALVQLADLRDARGTSDGRMQARAARRRVGDIYARELELADRASDVYERLAADAMGHEAVELEDELESLYQQLGRAAALEALLARKTARGGMEVQPDLLARRAALLEKLGDFSRAAEVLAELVKLRPDADPANAELRTRLADALGKAGRPEEQLAVLRARLQTLQGPERGEVELTCARLLIALDRGVETSRHRDEARAIVDRVLADAPGHPGAMQLLLRLQAGPAGYAAALERRAEAAPPAERAAAFRAAALVHRDEAADPASARRCFERALAEMGPDTAATETAELLAELGAMLESAGELQAAATLAERELELGRPETRQAVLHGLMGRAQLGRQEREAAARSWRRALGLDPTRGDAALGLAELAADSGAWDEVDALLRESPRTHLGNPILAATSYRSIARAAAQQGHPEEALQALLEADRLAPGDIRTRVELTSNRYGAHRFREAAQWANLLAQRTDLAAAATAADAIPATAEALYQGALSELKLRREERALPLLRQVLELVPGHEGALGMSIERLVERGDVVAALPMCRAHALAALDDATRAARWERVGDLLGDHELGETPAAHLPRAEAYLSAVAASGESPSESLLDKAARSARAAERLDDAARLATVLLARPASPSVRATRLTEAAALDALLKAPDSMSRAEARLTEAHGLAPNDEATLDALSSLLVAIGKHDAAAQLLTRALGLAALPAVAGRLRRATLWERLGACREKLRDPLHAAQAYERALELDPTRGPLRDWLIERYRSDGNSGDIGALVAHLTANLLHTPRAPNALRAALEHAGDAPRRRRLLEILALAGAASAAETTALATLRKEALEREQRLPGILDESEHDALAPPDARVLGPVMAALWDGLGASKSPLLGTVALPEWRISTVGNDELSRSVAVCLRALGNQRTGVYRDPNASADLTLSAQPPTALLVHPRFAETHRAAAQRFMLGRALELLRPEYVLAAALPAKQFATLFGQVLAAFHPRHVGTRKADADELRRRLPYKAARRLADLFEQLRDTEFSSARWRLAVQTAAARAGLVVSGDLQASAAVLDVEGDRAHADELLRFGLSDDFLALRAHLWM